MNIFSKEMLFAGDNTWVRPNLTANGTVGGNSFAVSSSDNSTEEYKAVDGSSTYTTLSLYSDFYFYNPTPLKVTQLVASYKSSYYGKVYEIAGSNKSTSSSFTTISFSRSGTTTETVTLSNSTYYKYYRITFTRGSTSVKTIRLAELQITAEEQ